MILKAFSIEISAVINPFRLQTQCEELGSVFSLKNNFVITTNNLSESVEFLFCFHQKTMFIYIMDERIAEYPKPVCARQDPHLPQDLMLYVHAQKIVMMTGWHPPRKFALHFFNQQSAGHCTMDNRVVYNKIAASFSWRVLQQNAMNQMRFQA